MDNIKRQYEKMGKRTLFMFVLKRSVLLFVILLVLLVLVGFYRFVPADYTGVFLNIIFAVLAVFVVAFLIVFLLAWLEYGHYGVFINEESFKVTRGVLNIVEIGVPYGRVKEVRIERNMLSQIFGVSNVIVTVLGGDENDTSSKGQSKIILPLIEKKIASEIQNNILNKVQTGKTNII